MYKSTRSTTGADNSGASQPAEAGKPADTFMAFFFSQYRDAAHEFSIRTVRRTARIQRAISAANSYQVRREQPFRSITKDVAQAADRCNVDSQLTDGVHRLERQEEQEGRGRERRKGGCRRERLGACSKAAEDDGIHCSSRSPPYHSARLHGQPLTLGLSRRAYLPHSHGRRLPA